MKRLFLFVALTGLTVSARSQDSGVLQDLGPVRVLVHAWGETLNSSRIRRGVEAQLRDAGVPLAGFGEVPTGYLNVEVRPYCDASDLCVYSVDVLLNEDVIVSRNGLGLVYPAYTWRSTGVVGYVGLDNVEDILVDVEAEVDTFAQQYISANRAY